MAGITFGGLSSGLDTNSIISKLMELEQRPLSRLTQEKAYHNARLAAFTSLNAKLSALSIEVDKLAEKGPSAGRSSSMSASGFFSASVGSEAAVGPHWLTVESLAAAERQVSQGVSSSTEAIFGTGTLTLTIDGTPTEIPIDSEHNTLSAIAGQINEAALGVTATIMNDGTGTPYRLVLSADEANKPFTLTSALVDGAVNDLMMAIKTPASQAHVVVDGIDVYADTNTLTEAIEGVTLDLLKVDTAEPKTEVTLTISRDLEAAKKQVRSFMNAYNGVLSFIDSQIPDASGKNAGILAADPGVRAIRMRLQDLITTRSGGLSMAELGFKTGRDGTLSLDESKLSAALQDNPLAVQQFFAGAAGSDGIADKLSEYLDKLTEGDYGFLAARKKGIDETVRSIDINITRVQARLSTREETLRAQFTAMEGIMSTLNAQSSFLTQQMSMLANLTSKK